MGKIRVKALGIEEEEKKQQKESKKRKESKKSFVAKALKDKAEKKADVVVASEQAEPDQQATAPITTAKPAKKEKFQKAKKQRRSKSYQLKAQIVDKQKTYSLTQALQLLEQLKRTKFDETVELHINTAEQGVSGILTLPHGTGKMTRVVIADDQIISDVEKGMINFDILVATPAMMPKLAKVARILGPKGLMPNPKNGTVSQKPEDIVKKYEGGQMHFKTEAKAPAIHFSVGKMSFGEKKLRENIQAALDAVKKQNIKNVTLKSTMSPGIKIQTN